MRTIKTNKIFNHSKNEQIENTGQPEVLSTVDDYKTRLLKLIPSEIIAAYVAMDGILKSNMLILQTEKLYNILVWSIFGALLILTPIYLYKFMKVKPAVQLILSSIAFAIWVMTLGGPFFLLLGNATFILGSVILVFYTLVVPILYK